MPNTLIISNQPPIAIPAGIDLAVIMGFAVAMIPVVLFPILRKFNEVLALGAVLFRGRLRALPIWLL
jgi:hypothetical protein